MLIKEPMLTAIPAAMVGENLNNGLFKPGGKLKAAAANGQDPHVMHAAMASGSFTGRAAASRRSAMNPINWHALINSDDCPDGWENKEPPAGLVPRNAGCAGARNGALGCSEWVRGLVLLSPAFLLDSFFPTLVLGSSPACSSTSDPHVCVHLRAFRHSKLANCMTVILKENLHVVFPQGNTHVRAPGLQPAHDCIAPAFASVPCTLASHPCPWSLCFASVPLVGREGGGGVCADALCARVLACSDGKKPKDRDAAQTQALLATAAQSFNDVSPYACIPSLHGLRCLQVL